MTTLLIITAILALVIWFIKPLTTPQGQTILNFILIELANGMDPFDLKNKLMNRYNLPSFVAYHTIIKAQEGDENWFELNDISGDKNP